VAAHEEDDLKTRGHITTFLHNYKTVILPLRIPKKPLWAENAGLMTWTD